MISSVGGLVLIALCGLILYALVQGAPYVPTRRKEAEMALRLMRLPKGATIVDMGSGDGAVLLAAAKQGYRTVGVELNPLLYVISKLRLRRYPDARVYRANMWRWQLPAETAGVFLFTAGPFAGRMADYLRREQRRLARPLTVVSLGFELPGLKPAARKGACIRYVLKGRALQG